LKPAVPKRILLFIAAGVWTFAGSMLLFKGFKMVGPANQHPWLEYISSLIGGLIFYWKMFSKLSLKHTLRILHLREEYPCLFSFFNFRSYLVMALMITMGITLRKSGWVGPVYLSFLYLTMSVPLLLSSIRFYYTGIYYKRFIVCNGQLTIDN
jgi:hypothetical protein